jgi:hypothetical protein
MTTTINVIREWLKAGQAQKATHMIVVCDTFDYDDYPIYVMPGEDVREREKEFKGVNMQKVMEVYNLSMDIEQQLKPGIRTFNY